MHQTNELCDTVLTLQRDLRLTVEQAMLIRREMGALVAASRNNAQLYRSLSRVQHELDCLKKAVIWYDEAESASECRRAQSDMIQLARKVAE